MGRMPPRTRRSSGTSTPGCLHRDDPGSGPGDRQGPHEAGEVQTEQAQALVVDLVERSRKNTEKLREQVRSEVRDQVEAPRPRQREGPRALPRRQRPGEEGGQEEERAAKKAPAKKKAAKKKAPAKKKAAKKKAPAKKAPPRRPRPPRRPHRELTRTARRRLDAELVRRGLAPSREQARAAIEADRVTVDGAPATKPARMVGARPGAGRRRPGPALRRPRRREARAARSSASTSIVAGRRVLDAVRPPAASPTACSRRGAARSSRSTSAATSCTSGSGPTRGWSVRERTDVRELGPPRRIGERPRAGRGRPVLHLAAHGRRGAPRSGRAGRRPRRAGEAAVRGGPGGGLEGPRA